MIPPAKMWVHPSSKEGRCDSTLSVFRGLSCWCLSIFVREGKDDLGKDQSDLFKFNTLNLITILGI